MSIFDIFISLPYGIFFVNKHFGNKKTTYVFIVDSIGDTLYTLGYLPELRVKTKSNKITIFITKRQIELCEMYPNSFDDMKVINNYIQKLLFRFFTMKYGFHYLTQQHNLYVIHPGIYFKNTFRYISNYPGVNFASFIRYGILGLDNSSNFSMPTNLLSDISIYIDTYKLKRGKGIILCPSANSIDQISEKFFMELASELTLQGYQVLTNTVNDDIAIQNTIRISCNLKYIPLIAEYCGCVIGLRSGILDLAALSTAMVIALYPVHSNLMSFYDIQSVIKSEKLEQMVLTENMKSDVQKVINLLQNKE